MIFVGLPLVVGDARPGSINDLLNDTLADAWGYALVVGAIGLLVAIFWPNPVTGILIEQVAQVVVGVVMLIYGYAVYRTHADGAGVVVGLAASVAVSAFRRWWQLRRLLRSAQEASHGP
jgi:uncharacterized protein YqgC (DUF456 family)